MDHISIVIVHYNTDEDTKACLQSLTKVKSDGFKFTTIVVDNASKEALTLPRSLQDKEIEVVRSQANLGFTGGNNLGVKYAIEKYNSDFVLLLNSDTLVHERFLIELHRTARKQTGAGLFCPKIYFAAGNEFHLKSYNLKQRGSVLWYAGGSIDWRNLYSFHRGVDEVDRGQFDAQRESEFATGCAVFISREVLETVGLLDPRFFLYSEDVDLSLRARKRGYSLQFVPESIVWHKNAGSSGGSGSLVQQYYQTRNRLWLTLKHGTWRARLTGLRLFIQLLTSGTPIERRAVTDLLLGRLGKQPVL